MKEKRYIIIRDCQGGEFGMYRAYTAEEWKEQMLEWCEQDGNEEMYEFIEKEYIGENLENVINELTDTWDLEVEELSKDNEEVIKYLKDLIDTQYDSYRNEIEWAKLLLKELGVK